MLVALSRAAKTHPPRAEDAHALGEIASSIGKCQYAVAAAAKQQAEADLPDDPSVPTACLEYQRTLEHLVDCRAIPKATRDGLALSVKSLSNTWSTVRTLPTAARNSLRDSCSLGLDTLREVAKTFHCKP